MNNFQTYAKEFRKKIDSLILWAEAHFPKESSTPSDWMPTKSPHPRLELFMRYYEYKLGKKYEPRNLPSEGGAAQRSEAKSNAHEYREAVRAYLAQTPRGVLEKATYFRFISQFDYWLHAAREAAPEENQTINY